MVTDYVKVITKTYLAIIRLSNDTMLLSLSDTEWFYNVIKGQGLQNIENVGSHLNTSLPEGLIMGIFKWPSIWTTGSYRCVPKENLWQTVVSGIWNTFTSKVQYWRGSVIEGKWAQRKVSRFHISRRCQLCLEVRLHWQCLVIAVV